MMRDFFKTYDRNPHFTGRAEVLNDVNIALKANKPVALVGPDGNGKSQIAEEYARLHVVDYDFIFWVRANDQTTLAIDYAEMSKLQNMSYDEEGSLIEAIENVQRWFVQNSRWLLIFDGATSLQSLEEFLPRSETGKVIITSSDAILENVATTIAVEPLKRSESIQFLQKRTGIEDGTSSDALAEVLGDLPMALEMAGAYISSTGITISEYLKIYQKNLHKGLNQISSHCPDSIATIWDISYQQVQALSQEGADLLNLSAFLSPDDLPIDILVEASTLQFQSLDDAVKVLNQRGLIKIGEESLSVHPLIQAATFIHLNKESRATWVESTLMALSGAFSAYLENISTWPKCARMLPHAFVLSEHAQNMEIEPMETSTLLSQVGLYLHRRGYFTGAKVALERLLAIDEKIFGPNHQEVATDLNNLGGVLRAMGDLIGARENFKRSLKIEESAKEPDHIKIAVRANNLGTVLRALGDLDEAMEAFQRALVIDEASYGPNHFKTAIRINNLGEVLQEMGDVDNARDHYQRALLIFQEFLGFGHKYTQRAQENLDSLSQGR